MKAIVPVALLSATILLGGCVDSETTRETSGAAPKINPSTLVGMRAGSLDAEMGRQGFTNTGGYKADGASMTTRYKATAHQCISVETRNGKIANAENIVEGNCQ